MRQHLLLRGIELSRSDQRLDQGALSEEGVGSSCARVRDDPPELADSLRSPDRLPEPGLRNPEANLRTDGARRERFRFGGQPGTRGGIVQDRRIVS